MTASIRRGRVIVAAALILLVACFIPFAIINLVRVLAESSPSFGDIFLFALPLFLFGTWRGWPTVGTARTGLVFGYGVLAFVCAGFSVFWLVTWGLMGDLPPAPPDGLVLGSVFVLPAAVFAAVTYVLAFSPSVRDFWNYRRDVNQEEFRNG